MPDTRHALEIERAVRSLGLADRPFETHVSLRSFGGHIGRAEAIVDGALAAGSTVLAATMAPDVFGIPAPSHDRPARNGIDYAAEDRRARSVDRSSVAVYDASSTVVSTWLGGFSAHVARREDRVRCRYGSGEPAGVGPLAQTLIAAETQRTCSVPFVRSANTKAASC